MTDPINETTPTEPIEPAVTAAPAADVPPAVPAAGVAASSGAPAPATKVTRTAAIVGGAALALLLLVGVFAAGAAFGGRLHGGVQRGQYAVQGQGAPGMMQQAPNGWQQGQGGPGMMRGRGYDRDGDQGYGRRGGNGYNGAPQGFGGQGSTTPTAPVPAVPGQ